VLVNTVGLSVSSAEQHPLGKCIFVSSAVMLQILSQDRGRLKNRTELCFELTIFDIYLHVPALVQFCVPLIFFETRS